MALPLTFFLHGRQGGDEVVLMVVVTTLPASLPPLPSLAPFFPPSFLGLRKPWYCGSHSNSLQWKEVDTARSGLSLLTASNSFSKTKLSSGSYMRSTS